MQAQVDIAVQAAARSGQAPTWDIGTDTLLWVDPPTHTVHRYAPGHTDHTMQVPQQVSAAKPRSRGGLVLHLSGGIALFEADGEHRTWLVYWARDGVHGGETMIDRKGRLWATTVHEGERGDGWLARIGSDGAAGIVLRGLAAGHGIGWSPDDTRMYVADSATRRIGVLDFDLASGATGEHRVLCEVDGEPAGLCVDAADNIWVAVRDKGEIRCYTPKGELDQTIPLPVRRPTACCFGGTDLTDLYVTSAREGVTDPTDADGCLLVLPNTSTGTRASAFTG
ncbi:SMP-30/gluconolactonase/LRE family protein [Saccharopolyspora sp. K220]|uniref:SMP-30/gluconolactonase/LRE family protein n=1 Tax=Saccharopolyspora soli TaxID=2926618 RepID=UPI001F593A71|nr:SMP-30/gluconolactonase/LRE family protein [Saccharopolyspora soli]MCI2423528.1 SMP-30/gluconolactonase/LRE family protein [Saccharopolyspora soli]